MESGSANQECGVTNHELSELLNFLYSYVSYNGASYYVPDYSFTFFSPNDKITEIKYEKLKKLGYVSFRIISDMARHVSCTHVCLTQKGFDTINEYGKFKML